MKIIVLNSEKTKALREQYPLFQSEHLKKLSFVVVEKVLSHFQALRAFEKQNLKPLIEICLQDEEEIRFLNKSTREKDASTDVLSFPEWNYVKGLLPQEEEEEIALSVEQNPAFLEEGILFGSMSLCLPIVVEQAKQYGHSLGRELAFLMVHSLLHLLGYDHMEEADKEEMEALQEQFMQALGFTRELSEEAFFETLQTLNTPALEDFEYEEEDVESFIALDGYSAPFDYSDIPSLQEEEEDELVHSGFITIIGRANAGKSTLLNRLSGVNIAIVSRKAQTTRHNIRAIVDEKDAQLIFTDTPGLHHADSKLGDFMLEKAWEGLENADLILLLVDASKIKKTEFETKCLEKAKALNKKVLVVFNKCDAVKKESLLPFIESYAQEEQVLEVFPISAQTGQGVLPLLDYIKGLLPKTLRPFPMGSFTDQTEKQIVGEYIREQILHYCHEEIPHGTAVLIDKFEEIGTPEQIERQERKLVRIFASILCEKDSHKAILIGKKGANLKRIATASRIKMEELLNSKVYLELHVKVREDWKNRAVFLRDLGYEKKK